MNTFAFFILIGLAGLGIHFAYAAHRRKQVQAVADKLGLEFVAQADFLDELRKFPVTNPGHWKKCINSIEGEAQGVKFRLFEYGYWVRAGKRQVPVSHTVAYLTSDRHQFPSFQIRTKSFFDKLTGLMGGQTVSITPEFDRRFVVQSYEESATRKLFNQQLMDELMLHSHCIEADGNGFVLYRPNHTVNHTLLEHFLKDSLKLMMLLQGSSDDPEPVWKEPEIVVGEDGRLSLAK